MEEGFYTARKCQCFSYLPIELTSFLPSTWNSWGRENLQCLSNEFRIVRVFFSGHNGLSLMVIPSLNTQHKMLWIILWREKKKDESKIYFNVLPFENMQRTKREKKKKNLNESRTTQSASKLATAFFISRPFSVALVIVWITNKISK